MSEGNSANQPASAAKPASTLRKSSRQGRSLLPLFIGLAVVIAFFVTSSLVGYTKIRTLRDNSQMVAHTHVVIKTLGEILLLATDAETGQRGFLLTGEAQYLEPYTLALGKIDAQVEQLERLVADNPEQSGRVPVIQRHLAAKRAELAETIEVRRTRGLQAVLPIVLSDRGKVTMDALRQSVAAMVGTEEALRARRLAEANVAFQTAVWSTVSVSLVGLVLAAVITSLLRRAELAKQRQEWIQAGQLRLAVQMVGDQKVAELADNSLRFLSDYLGAQAGAMYIEEGRVLQRAAIYALPTGNAIPERLTLGEGLVGQVAKDGKPVAVHDVPEGYLAIGSALGHHRPRHLLIVPATVDGSVNAVLEFGFFHQIPDDAIELLERVAETIGVAVRSARLRARVQELLEETQTQAEEVQAQSEELRVSNEELEEQTRALKESQANLEEQQSTLEETNAQLEQQTRVLENQKEELHQAGANLEKQARIVEQASRYKSEFLANMSHELRTPLNSSLILAKLLADNKSGNLTPEQIKYAQTIQAAGNDLLGLINEVLDLSKVEAGRIEIIPEAVTVARLTDTLRSLFEQTATQKGVTFRLEVGPKVPSTLVTDAQRLEQVLKNLLSNALKFTERGEVAFTVERARDGRIAFSVRDTGIGIPPEQQQIIFEPFRQGDGTTNRKYGGTGLGLSISRELVRLLGGEIQLTSSAGKGSTFTILLPEVYDGPTAPREANESASDTFAPKTPGASSPARTAPAVAIRRIPDDRERLSGNARVILIVEDDEPFVQIVVDLAHELHFQALVATTADEALALARQYLPSAVVLDVGLPDNSGLFVLERLKQDARTRHIPVHVVSASDYTNKALSMGAIGYMLKPVKREQLAEAFEKLENRLTQKLQRVLIVEDNEVQMESLQRLLGTNGVETAGAKTAAECLEQLKTTTFDCMVLDLTLPDASGFSLLETLSANDSYSFPPVIVYTARELSQPEEQRLRKYSKSIIIKGAKSPERLLDEVTLFLHQVVSDLPAEQQNLLAKARGRDEMLAGRHILLVEDDVRNVFALTSLFEPHGVKLSIARNGREALESLAKNESVDLVLMDLMMPEMDGMTAMREIRKRPEWKKLPIIALTAKAMRNDREQSLEAGANDYLAKPIDVEKLLSLVRVWMPR
ncbi:response regulator [Oleiharenicola lentus]|uniref:response regulator n=1 Tax=Oleiharenicola lentus TaxID=2508720 RepID=UPI003F664D00